MRLSWWLFRGGCATRARVKVLVGWGVGSSGKTRGTWDVIRYLAAQVPSTDSCVHPSFTTCKHFSTAYPFNLFKGMSAPTSNVASEQVVQVDHPPAFEVLVTFLNYKCQDATKT
jgi:hypothetical protein